MTLRDELVLLGPEPFESDESAPRRLAAFGRGGPGLLHHEAIALGPERGGDGVMTWSLLT